MKAFLIGLVIAAAVLPVAAQTDTSVEAERVRIAAERRRADAGFVAQEVACYKTFAVTDCLKAARSQRRELLADLRRQELSLNDADRKRRAAERVRSIEDRNSAQQQEDKAAQRADAIQRQQEKKEDLARRAAERSQAQAPAAKRSSSSQKESRERQASVRTAREKKSHDPADDLRRSQQRQLEAQERKERVAKRLAEAAKSGVKPLPVPP